MLRSYIIRVRTLGNASVLMAGSLPNESTLRNLADEISRRGFAKADTFSILLPPLQNRPAVEYIPADFGDASLVSCGLFGRNATITLQSFEPAVSSTMHSRTTALFDGELDFKHEMARSFWESARFVLCTDSVLHQNKGGLLHHSAAIMSTTVVVKVAIKEFTVTFYQPDLHYHFRAGSCAECDGWVDVLNDAIKKSSYDSFLELLWSIESSESALTEIEIKGQLFSPFHFQEHGCRLLARVLSLNTCVTSLDLSCSIVGPAGSSLIFPALTHLTAMTVLNLRCTDIQSSGAVHLCCTLTHLTSLTCLDLHDTGLQSSGASLLCSALVHLTSLIRLDVSYNELTAKYGARICCAAAAAGMTNLMDLDLDGNCFEPRSLCELLGILDIMEPHYFADPALLTYACLTQFLARGDDDDEKKWYQCSWALGLQPELLWSIKKNDPAVTDLQISEDCHPFRWVRTSGIEMVNLQKPLLRVLASAFALNTCITSLSILGMCLLPLPSFDTQPHFDSNPILDIEGYGDDIDVHVHADVDADADADADFAMVDEVLKKRLEDLKKELEDLKSQSLDLRDLEFREDLREYRRENLFFPLSVSHEGSLIFTSLSHLTNLTYLDLSTTTVGLSSCDEPPLIGALVHLTALTFLDLSECSVDSLGSKRVCTTFKFLTALTHLDLSSNVLTDDDGALICQSAAAAGMSRLLKLILDGSNIDSVFSVVKCWLWGQLNLPQPPADFMARMDFADFAGLTHYLMFSDTVNFSKVFLMGMNPWLLHFIESNDSAVTELNLRGIRCLPEDGCLAIAKALSLNTRLTSLNLAKTLVHSPVSRLMFNALTHLTSLTCLNLHDTGLQSSGASLLCSALVHLTSLIRLDVSYNKLTADDGARICCAAAAAGMTNLMHLDLDGNCFEPRSIVLCDSWQKFNLPQLPLDTVAEITTFTDLWSFIICNHISPFVDWHPANLPHRLLRLIATSDPFLTDLDGKRFGFFKTLGECSAFARALSFNTCVTALRLAAISPAASTLFFPVLTHLTSLTCLDLHDTGLQSSGASLLCSALVHLTSLIRLDVSYNKLNADDGARICCAAAAAGMTNLMDLGLNDDPYRPCDDYGISASSIVLCGAWKQLKLPLPPDEIIGKCGYNCAPLVSYLLSEDKVSIYSIRVFVVGESTVNSPSAAYSSLLYCSFFFVLCMYAVFFLVSSLTIDLHRCDVLLQAGKTSLVQALMSPSSRCASIDTDDRTVGVDRYHMQLKPNERSIASACHQGAVFSSTSNTLLTESQVIRNFIYNN
jgi:Ran GTPase-activating protein (RanGAP) involved in mRNA processing and transport